MTRETLEDSKTESATVLKKAYAPPTLQILGRVSDLTLGGGASTSDGVNTTMMAI